MSSNKSVLDDKSALQYRLALGAATATATSKGGRGTLTRSAQNLLGELLHAQSAPPTSSSSSASDTRRDAVRELRLLQVEMNKMLLVLNRIQRETQQLDDEEPESAVEEGGGAGAGRDFRALSQRVHELRHQVGTAQQAQACQVEYEALATLLHRRHAVPQHILQSQIDAIDRQADDATRELQHKQGALKVRTAQVSALAQSILDLKQSLLVSGDDDGGSEEAAPTPLPASATKMAAASESSVDGGPAKKKRRRLDSGGGGAELSGVSKPPPNGTASTPNDDSGMEDGEELNARRDRDGGKARAGGEDDEEEEEELYGDL